MYNGTTTFTATDLVAGNIITGDVVNLSGSATISSANVGTYTIFVVNSLISINNNYSVTGGTVTLTITPQTANPVADAYYTGSNFYWTTGSSSKTATLTLTATITNNLNFTGNITTAKVSFYLCSGTTVTPIAGAQNLPVGLVNPGDLSTETATAMLQYNLGSAMATTLQIKVKVTGNYVENPSSVYDGLITIAVPAPGGLICGGGNLCNTNSAGYVKGAAAKRSNFSFFVQYNKSMTNSQGGVELLVRSYNDRFGNVTGVLHTYRIKSTAISSLSVQSPKSQFSSKANISEIINGVETSIEGGCTMLIDLFDGNAPGVNPVQADLMGITVYRKAGGVWYSNDWNSVKTITAPLCAGQLSITGNPALI